MLASLAPGHGLAQDAQEGHDGGMFHLPGSLVNHEAGADMGNMFQGEQAVGLEGITALDQIDNQVRQPHQGGQLHGAIQLDDLHLLTLGGEVAFGAFDVFGGDTPPPEGSAASGIPATIIRQRAIRRSRGS